MRPEGFQHGKNKSEARNKLCPAALWHRAEEEQIDGGGREERETDENGRSGLFLKVLCFSNTHLYVKPHLVCVIKALTALHQLTLLCHMGSDTFPAEEGEELGGNHRGQTDEKKSHTSSGEEEKRCAQLE